MWPERDDEHRAYGAVCVGIRADEGTGEGPGNSDIIGGWLGDADAIPVVGESIVLGAEQYVAWESGAIVHARRTCQGGREEQGVGTKTAGQEFDGLFWGLTKALGGSVALV